MRILTIACLLVLASGLRAQSGSFSMQEAILYAKENHRDVKKSLLDIADADGNIKEFTAIGLPKLNGGVELQHFIDVPTSIIPQGSFFAGDPDLGLPPNPAQDLEVQFGVKNNLTASLSAEFLLFDGSFLVGLKGARLFRDLIAKRANISKDDVAVATAKAYLGVLVAYKNLDIIDKNIASLQSIHDETYKIYQEGFVEKLDVDRLELSLHNLQTDRQKLQSIIGISKNVLKFSMGYPMTDSLAVTETLDDLLLSPLESATYLEEESQYENRSEHIALKASEELNALNVRRLKIGYVPTLRGFASYAQVLQANSFSTGKWFPTTIVGLTLDVPIFDGNEKKSKIQRAKITQEQTLLDIEQLKEAIDLEVENAKLQFRNNLNTVESSERSEALAQNIYDTALIKYREGVGTSVEVTQAEAELYRAQGGLVNALYDLLLAKVDLEKALGKL